MRDKDHKIGNGTAYHAVPFLLYGVFHHISPEKSLDVKIFHDTHMDGPCKAVLVVFRV